MNRYYNTLRSMRWFRKIRGHTRVREGRNGGLGRIPFLPFARSPRALLKN